MGLLASLWQFFSTNSQSPSYPLTWLLLFERSAVTSGWLLFAQVWTNLPCRQTHHFPNIAKMLKERFKALTGLRAVAAIMVFLYHNRKYWRGWLPGFFIQNLNEFHTGVTLFFVLSGFLIAYTYQDTPLQSSRQYIKYILVRLLRIFPVYLIILTISYCNYGFPPIHLSIYNFTLLKGFSDRYNLEGLPQSWSLTVELTFYLFAPAIYSLLKRNYYQALGFLLSLAGISLLIGYGWFYCNGNHDRWLYNWLFIFDCTFFGRFIEFMGGMILAHQLRISKGNTKLIPLKNSTLISGILSLCTIYVISLFEVNIFDQGTQHVGGLILRNLLLPILFCSFIYGLMVEQTWLSRLLSTRVVMLLGDSSYIFYLIHIGYVNRKLYNHQPLGDRNFIILWLISIVGYLLIEKPLYIFFKQKIKD